MSEARDDKLAELAGRLLAAGFSEWEASNLMDALRSDCGLDELLAKAEVWVEWCCTLRTQWNTMLLPAANGAMQVDVGDDLQIGFLYAPFGKSLPGLYTDSE